jgi:hypothetical protein
MAWTRPFDRGHGRCSVRGLTLTVTGTPEPRDLASGSTRQVPWSTGHGGYPGAAPPAPKEAVHMLVAAFNSPKDPSWRWRIVNYAGDTIAESREHFLSIGAAVAQGAKKLAAMNVVDHSQPVNWRRSTSHLRGR